MGNTGLPMPMGVPVRPGWRSKESKARNVLPNAHGLVNSGHGMACYDMGVLRRMTWIVEGMGVLRLFPWFFWS